MKLTADPHRDPRLTPHDGGSQLSLGALLLREGLVSTEQLEWALAERESTGHRVGEILVAQGWVHPAAVARLLAEQHGLEYLDVSTVDIEAAACSLLSESYARRYFALPVRFLAEDLIQVAVVDPTNVGASDDLRLAIGLNVRFVITTADELTVAIDRAYRSVLDFTLDDGGDGNEALLEDVSSAATSAPAINLVNALITHAIEERASDLHFVPQGKQMIVRARVDGMMRTLTVVSRAMQPAVTSRLKIMGSLDIAERRRPQDGRVTVRYGGLPIDMRIAVLPTMHGEQVVLRLMSVLGGRPGLGELGMSADAEERFAQAIREPYGAVLAVGPTGSGKTTTLYAALDLLNHDDRVLVTIEDPVEYQTPGITQVEVNPRSGLTFARGLRTILRSDPDVLLVGEIRDEETARIAIQAAMTGHVVLTTLHARNAASSISRLADMGIERGLLAASINCIVAQRLARRLCVNCRQPYSPEASETADLLGITEAPEDLILFRPGGCAHCAKTGYAGRVALYEVMLVQGRLRRLIEAGSTDEIFAEAVAQGMTTLRADGMRLALAGISSLDEVRRVTGERLV
jgi:type IV pilus assembly protein PilB